MASLYPWHSRTHLIPQVQECLENFLKVRKEAIVDEQMRTAKAGTGTTKRPDLVAMGRVVKDGPHMKGARVTGAIPGISAGQAFLSRAELCILGMCGGGRYLGESLGCVRSWVDLT